MSPDIIERFWARVEMIPFSECWLWTGALVHRDYGTLNGKRAHRLSWEIHNGPIPDDCPDPLGWFVCHKCDNPPCVRPDHLFLGTSQDNVDDALRKGRHTARTNRKEPAPVAPEMVGNLNSWVKTHCVKGHALEPENVYVRTYRGRKQRVCLSCQRARNVSGYAIGKRRRSEEMAALKTKLSELTTENEGLRAEMARLKAALVKESFEHDATVAKRNALVDKVIARTKESDGLRGALRGLIAWVETPQVQRAFLLGALRLPVPEFASKGEEILATARAALALSESRKP